MFDLGALLTEETTTIDSNSRVGVVRNEERSIGLLVSELHGVAKFDAAQIIRTPLANGDGGMLVDRMIKANEGRVLIQLIDLDYLLKMPGDPDGGECVGNSHVLGKML